MQRSLPRQLRSFGSRGTRPSEIVDPENDSGSEITAGSDRDHLRRRDLRRGRSVAEAEEKNRPVASHEKGRTKPTRSGARWRSPSSDAENRQQSFSCDQESQINLGNPE